MGDAVYKVRRDYKAKRNSGTRPYSSITYFVIHDAEAPLPEKGAEAVGRYFESSAARGSTQYGIDIDSTQQYANDNVICWGAPPLNSSGLHVECAGKASLTRKQWLTIYAPMFRRLGWLIENRTRKYGIPLEVLSVAELKKRGANPSKGKGGIVTHATISKAFKQSDHTDPGAGFPIDVVMAWAHKFRQGRIKGHLSRPVLHIYGINPLWVKRLQTDLAAHHMYKGKIDGVFGVSTETAVKTFQKKHGLPDNGVVGIATWKALDK